MERQFFTLNGKKIHDYIDYISTYIQDNPDTEVLIGADSQCMGTNKTVYGVVIALKRKGKGAHVLCTRKNDRFENNINTRLLSEVWFAVEIAEELRQAKTPIFAKFIDIDLNPDPIYKSNNVLRQAIGLVEGMGYKVRYKQNGAVITYAANKLVRK